MDALGCGNAPPTGCLFHFIAMPCHYYCPILTNPVRLVRYCSPLNFIPPLPILCESMTSLSNTTLVFNGFACDGPSLFSLLPRVEVPSDLNSLAETVPGPSSGHFSECDLYHGCGCGPQT